MERQLVLMQHFVQACCGSGAEASVHQLMASSLAQPQRLLGAVLALILAGSGGMNHKGSALDLERQDAQGCTLMHYICSLRNGPALQLLLLIPSVPTAGSPPLLLRAGLALLYVAATLTVTSAWGYFVAAAPLLLENADDRAG